MFNKKTNNVVSTTTGTIIGKDTLFTGGRLGGQGAVRIDGQFVGEIDIGGHLVLGESGNIEGNVKVKSMLLAGKMYGNITCEGSLHMVSTGMLKGDIQAGSLVVDEGAKFAGNCNMSTKSENIKNTQPAAQTPAEENKNPTVQGKVEIPY